MKKFNTEIFIERSKIIHGDKYDYSLVEYKNSHDKVKIICYIHGVFEQLPYHHLNKNGCPSCAGCKRITTKEFIEKSKIIHGDKYSYHLTNYINRNTNVKIFCKEHGVFEQIPKFHLNGSGCPKCSGRNLIFSEIENMMREVHGNKYDHYPDTYIGKSYKLKMRCKIHDFIFHQYIGNHLKGWGCPKCSKRHNYSNDEFKEICKHVHDNKYDYTLTNYVNSKSLIKIICPKHGVFEQLSSYHISGHGCPICKTSKGEMIILNFLKEHNIGFTHQKRFNGCKDKYTLPFDFYLPDYNLCIEYQGRQHFDSIMGWGDVKSFNIIKKHDKIKSDFCEKK